MRQMAMMMLLGWTLGAGAQQAHTPEPLWPAGAVPMAEGTAAEDTPTITVYLPAANPTRTAVVIAPGGGYEHLAMQKEGEDIALWLNAHGVAGIVLKYRLGPKYHHPVELGDAERALRTVRAEAAKLGVAPDHIGIWGFSAGGHLAATAGTLYDSGKSQGDAVDRVSSRPDFMILAYPVIAMNTAYGHSGSIRNLIGANPPAELAAAVSPQLHVSAETPPAFLFATTDDGIVPVENSVAMYEALTEKKVAAEMHLYEHGPHGVGLAQGYPALKGWPDVLAGWMRARGYMGAASQ